MLLSVEYFALEGFTSTLLSLGLAVNDGTRCKTVENLAHAFAVFDHLFFLGKIFCSSPSPLLRNGNWEFLMCRAVPVWQKAGITALSPASCTSGAFQMAKDIATLVVFWQS